MASAEEEAALLAPATSAGVEAGVDMGVAVFPSVDPVGPTPEPVPSMPLGPGSNAFGLLLEATTPVTKIPLPTDSEPVVGVVYVVSPDVIIL